MKSRLIFASGFVCGAVVSAVAAALLFGAKTQNIEPATDASNGYATLAQPKLTAPADTRLYPMTFAEIYDSNESNSKNAVNWLKGKRLSIRGRVLDVSTKGDGVEIALGQPPDEPYRSAVQHLAFLFGKEALESAPNIHSGDIVTCVGSYTGLNVDSYDFAGESIRPDTR